MAGFGEERPWASHLWRLSTYAHKLVKPYRCKDPVYQRLMDAIRTAKPQGRVWGNFQRTFLRKQKAWPGDEPTVDHVKALLERHPNTTMLAVTRVGVAKMNDLAVQAKFGRRHPLIILRGDVEANPENYGPDNQLHRPCDLVP
eukprot:8299560-Lingulodinium_polyedra.AAC.1